MTQNKLVIETHNYEVDRQPGNSGHGHEQTLTFPQP